MSGSRRIIIGANGSPESIRALRYAEDLARFSDAILVPVIAWTPPGGEMAERRSPSAELRRVWATAATQRLRDAMDAAWGGLPDGLDVRAVIARGEAGAARGAGHGAHQAAARRDGRGVGRAPRWAGRPGRHRSRGAGAGAGRRGRYRG